MKTLRSTFIVLSIVALALIVVPVAMADTVTVLGTSIPTSTSVTTIMGTLSVGGFYSAPGIVAGDTLTGVEIILSGSGSTSNYVSIGNPPPIYTQPTGNGSVTIADFTNTTTLTLSGLTPSLVLSGTANAGGFVLTTTAPNTEYDTSGVFNILGSVVDAYPLDLIDYAISGNINYTLSGAANNGADYSLLTNNFAEGGGGSTVAGAQIEAIYTFDEPAGTPEPGTLTLFGTGLLGLAGLLRRKFAK